MSEKYFSGKMFNFANLFEYEYINEDFGTDNNNTVYYENVVLLKDLFDYKKGDRLQVIEFQVATGYLIHNDKKIYITECVINELQDQSQDEENLDTSSLLKSIIDIKESKYENEKLVESDNDENEYEKIKKQDI